MPTDKNEKSFSFLKKVRRKRTSIKIFLFAVVIIVGNRFAGNLFSLSCETFITSIKMHCFLAIEKFDKIISNIQYALFNDIDSYIRMLSDENSTLRWKLDQMETIKEENEHLKSILNLEQNLNFQYALIAAKVITIFSNDFIKSGILGVGSIHNVSIDDVVINNFGLIGRIIEVHKTWSKVMFIIDENSSIPAKIGKNNVNVIVQGNNTDILEIALIHDDEIIKIDDDVISSEYGGVFPENIKIGKVIMHKGKLSISPIVNFTALKYVNVIIKKHATK